MMTDLKTIELDEFISWILCISGIRETGEGTCSFVCMDQLGDARSGPCPHRVKVFEKQIAKIMKEKRGYSMTKYTHNEYLGDGVYASFDGYQIWLAANHHENRVVALEPKVIERLISYVKYLIKEGVLHD